MTFRETHTILMNGKLFTEYPSCNNDVFVLLLHSHKEKCEELQLLQTATYGIALYLL